MGLGNPGKTYQNNRHNLGYLVIDAIGQKYGVSCHTRTKLYHWTSFDVRTTDQERLPIILSKPLTFMNNSGLAVRQILMDFEISSDQVLIILDDLDLPLGKMRLREHGSEGGHRGLKSIIELIGTRAIPRLRVGIGPQGENEAAEDFVLADFTTAEKPLLGQVVQQAANCALEWAIADSRQVMNKYNALDLRQTLDFQNA